MTTFTIKRNDLLPVLAATLLDADGAAVDLSGTTVRFLMRTKPGNTVIVDGAADLVTPSEGAVSYTWQSGDTATAGIYEGEFEVTFPTAKPLTFPNDSYLLIQIKGDID